MTPQSAINESELLAQEAKVSNLLSLAWTEFAKLARDDSGRQDFLRMINQAQYMVLAGPGIRQLNQINLVNQANAISEAEAVAAQKANEPVATDLEQAQAEQAPPAPRPRRRAKE